MAIAKKSLTGSSSKSSPAKNVKHHTAASKLVNTKQTASKVVAAMSMKAPMSASLKSPMTLKAPMTASLKSPMLINN